MKSSVSKSWVVAFGLSLLSSVAFAADPAVPAAEVSEGPSRGKSVFERAHPGYETEGVRVRSFYVKPSVGVEEQYDSNIFAQQSNEKSDYITVVRPGLDVKSNWSRHALNLQGVADLGFYSDHDDENYNDYRVAADGRLDVLRETFFTGGVEYNKLHEDRGSPDNVNGKGPTEYSDAAARVGFFRGLHRFSVKLDGEAHQLDYDDVRTSTNSIIDNDVRDRKQYRTAARLGYEIQPGYEAFVRAAYDVRDYDTNLAASDRSSNGYETVVGTALDLSGKLRGEVYAGYMSQDYDRVAFRDIDGASFGGSLLWNPTGVTSVRGKVARSIEETTQSGASGFISTNYSLELEHELRRNILVGVNGGFGQNDYKGATSGIERSDDITNVGASLRYLLTRNTAIELRYGHQERDSNISGQDYTRDKVTLGLALSM